MKILTGIDVAFSPFGGSLVCCNDWYSNLPADVTVRFLALQPPPGQTKWWTIEDVAMLEVVKKRGAAEFPAYLAELTKAVKAQIDLFKPDIIHCQHLNYGLSRTFADLRPTIPMIGICHGTDVQAATADPFFKDNLEVICDAMNLLVFPNQNMADDFFTVYGKDHAHAINPLGVPDTYYDTYRHPTRFSGNETLRVLYAGRLLGWKGPDIAVQAMSLMQRDAHLTVIGNGDEPGYKQTLLDFVDKHHLESNVTFMPQLPREKLLAAFGDFDIIVFPSRRLEAFSLTVVEAQLAGLPVVCGQAGGIVSTVGDSGVLLPENTPKALAKILDDLYDHPTKLQELRQKGFENAEKYRLSSSQKRLFDLSKKLIQKSSAK